MSTPDHLKDDNLRSSKAHLQSIDWNFTNLNNAGIHSLHWYPATFVSAIPGTLIPILSEPDHLVVDPFCGTCTTGVEAVRLGRRFIGVDTNPVATLISRAKLLLPPGEEILKIFEKEKIASLFLGTSMSTQGAHPHESELLKWYHPNTYRELLFLLELISSIRVDAIRIAAQAIFSSILKNVSSQTKHWGWVCDNVAPKPADIHYRDALDVYRKALEDYAESTDRVRQDMSRRGLLFSRSELLSRWEIIQADAVGYLSDLPEGSVDLILTSPPYHGVADYIKSQRLSFLWAAEGYLTLDGHTGEDFDALRRREVGSRSYRHSHNSFDKYASFMEKFFLAAKQALRSEGFLAIVLGDSDARENASEFLEEAARRSGLTEFFSIERDIKYTRRRMRAKVRHERLIVYAR
jgi:DNA modification methylase